MDKANAIKSAQEFVRALLSGESTGHDWYHIERVTRTALFLAEKEGGDPFLIELIALLHDVSDHKLYENQQEGQDKLETFLNDFIVDKEVIEKVLLAIDGISFKGVQTAQNELSLEGKIVQDADRLDAIGAIGIARTFAYGGKKQRLIYDPEETPEVHDNFEDYKSNTSCTINHFYEKLLHLKDRMNTESAKEIAKKRHHFMEQFLSQFYHEWDFKGE